MKKLAYKGELYRTVARTKRLAQIVWGAFLCVDKLTSLLEN